ncbi:MAG: hypothetical protein JW847_05600 [Candidatus Omnitrophica bacterium]|nr:hypothetical protein [Candidatus Omnitrophota bacterium]
MEIGDTSGSNEMLKGLKRKEKEKAENGTNAFNNFRSMPHDSIKTNNDLPLTIHHSPFTDKAQVLLEFTFCMVIILLMLYGITKVLTWTGREYVGRSRAHDNVLYQNIDRDYQIIGEGPAKQIDPYYYTPVKLNAIWGEK